MQNPSQWGRNSAPGSELGEGDSSGFCPYHLPFSRPPASHGEVPGLARVSLWSLLVLTVCISKRITCHVLVWYTGFYFLSLKLACHSCFIGEKAQVQGSWNSCPWWWTPVVHSPPALPVLLCPEFLCPLRFRWKNTDLFICLTDIYLISLCAKHCARCWEWTVVDA